MKVAVAQIACAPGEIDTNLRKVAVFAGRARETGAELVVFPEVSDTGYVLPIIRESARMSAEGAGAVLAKLAQQLSIAILCGVAEREGDAIYNTQLLVDSAGQMVARYRKTHLFCAGSFDEGKCFAPGNEIVTHAMGGLRLGLSICYDLRFPELYRAQAIGVGVNVFVVSAAWPFPRAEHLRILAQARAIENQSYLLLSNRTGSDAGLTFCGGSAILDPYGTLLAAAAPDREELLLADLSLETLTATRERMPVLTHRRASLYAET